MATLNILVIGENLAERDSVIALSEEAGYRVTAVGNSHDAAAALERQHVDLVLMDVGATAAIRDQVGLRDKHLPTIAVSSHPSPEEREQCLRAGVDAYLTKPIQPTELIPTIEKLTKSVRSGQAPSTAEPGATPLTASLKLLAEIHSAIQVGDVASIRQSAEALKGSITSVLAKEAFAVATALENTECEDDLARAQEAFRRLQAAMNTLHPTYTDKTGN